jgi:hypothetical protein
MDAETYERVFAKRAIDRKVAEGRPHVPYDRGDWEAVAAVDGGWAARKGSLQHIVRQSSGVAMMRWPAIDADPGEVSRGGFYAYLAQMKVRPILAELRPDEPILVSEPKSHRHEAEVGPESADWVREHLTLPPQTLTRRGRSLELLDYRRAHGPRDKNGETVGPEVWHRHKHEAKYVFPSGTDQGRRLDAHPAARSLVEDACASSGVVYYALEGCLKADAVLSAGAGVVSVPSVSLYWPSEMYDFGERYLGGTAPPRRRPIGTPKYDGHPTVVVLTDSDWDSNPEVMFYGVEAAERLRRMGVHATYAAPPIVNGDRKTGVDDYLFAGGTLDELQSVEPIVHPIDDLRDYVSGHLRRGCGVSVRTAADVLRWHLIHATPEGEVLGKVNRCAGALWPDQPLNTAAVKVKRARRAMADVGILSQKEPMRKVRRWGSFEWEVLAPVDVIVPTGSLVTWDTSRTLADVLGNRR